jgi:DNA-directed RNA polymerase specialized sigma24 family protein
MQSDEFEVREAGPTIAEPNAASVDGPKIGPVQRGGRVAWRAVLSGASPREVLARLMAGDPLGLRARVARALERQALLLDPDRVLLRATARIARFAPRYRGQPELEPWLEGMIDDALADMLEADEEGEGEPAGAWGEFARPLGLAVDQLARACQAFNRLPLEERRAFRALVLEGRSLDECATRMGRSAAECARSVRRVLIGVLGCFEERAP